MDNDSSQSKATLKKIPTYVFLQKWSPFDNRSCNLVILSRKIVQMIQSERNRSEQINQFDETKFDKIHLPLLQPKIEHIFHKFRDKTNRQSLPGIQGPGMQHVMT